jgi:hypothetical protein
VEIRRASYLMTPPLPGKQAVGRGIDQAGEGIRTRRFRFHKQEGAERELIQMGDLGNQGHDGRVRSEGREVGEWGCRRLSLCQASIGGVASFRCCSAGHHKAATWLAKLNSRLALSRGYSCLDRPISNVIGYLLSLPCRMCRQHAVRRDGVR